MVKQEYDSKEELYFEWYCEELKEHELIYDYKYHEFVYLLSEKLTVPSIKVKNNKEKYYDRFVLHDHVYTPDFSLYWTPKGLELMTELSMLYDIFTDGYFELSKVNNKPVSIIDVKGSFAGRNNTTAVTFPLNQKWTYQKYGIFVQKVIPSHLFEDTFFPERYMTDDSGNKPRRKKQGIKLTELKDMNLPKIKEYLCERKSFTLEYQLQKRISYLV